MLGEMTCLGCIFATHKPDCGALCTVPAHRVKERRFATFSQSGADPVNRWPVTWQTGTTRPVGSRPGLTLGERLRNAFFTNAREEKDRGVSKETLPC